jgi:hypothetical protein
VAAGSIGSKLIPIPTAVFCGAARAKPALRPSSRKRVFTMPGDTWGKNDRAAFTDAAAAVFGGKITTPVAQTEKTLCSRCQNKPVILSAGAIGSPHILHELRGIGRNMQNHYTALVSYPIVGAETANERSPGPPLAGSIVAASVKVLEESATPDMQWTFAPGRFKGGQI